MNIEDRLVVARDRECGRVGEIGERKKVVIMSIFTSFLIIEESFSTSTLSIRFSVEFFLTHFIRLRKFSTIKV